MKRTIHGRPKWQCGVCQLTFLVAALFGAQTGMAQQTAVAKPLAVQATAARVLPAARLGGEDEEAASKPGEGIKMHGHWVIDVKNPDGTIVQHRDFENSLVAGPGLGLLSGDQILASLLTGKTAPGGLGIGLISGPVTTPGYDKSAFCSINNPLETPSPAGIQCFGLVGTNSAFVIASQYTVLKTSQVGLVTTLSMSPSVSIELSGNFTVLSSYGLTRIDAVQTLAAVCFLNKDFGSGGRFTGSASDYANTPVAPASCNSTQLDSTGYLGGALTSTPLAVPITGLVSNQIITLSVTLSFS